MRIALWDIAAPLKEKLRPLLDAADTFVDVPQAPSAPVSVDVVIASRFAEKDAARATFRLLQAPGAGTDKIAFDAVDPAAFVCNAYEHEGPIAEYVFAAILDHAIGYQALTRQIADKGWGGAYFSRPPHGEVAGCTLGLVGLGHIGAAVATRAKAFGMTVMAVTHSGRTQSQNVDWIATADRLGEMLARVDFLILACPLTEETRGTDGDGRVPPHEAKRAHHQRRAGGGLRRGRSFHGPEGGHYRWRRPRHLVQVSNGGRRHDDGARKFPLRVAPDCAHDAAFGGVDGRSMGAPL